jgi:riboflavin synthase
MFTGLVEGMGEVVEAQKGQGMLRLKLAWSGAPELSPGESIAVDGVCLTVVEIDAVSFQVDVIQETLDLTTLGRVRPGDPVNLERSLRLGDRLGGHLVQGHVDAMATVESVVRRGGDVRVNLELSRELSRYVAHKGSITLNGVSLTVAAVRGRSLQVALIPETLRATNLGGLSAEDLVNVEVDLLARYLDRLLQDREPADDAPAGAPERRPTP